jgi:hypothetical protein
MRLGTATTGKAGALCHIRSYSKGSYVVGFSAGHGIQKFLSNCDVQQNPANNTLKASIAHQSSILTFIQIIYNCES